MDRARRANSLQLAAVARAGRDVPCEQPGPAQGGDHAGVRAGQRPALGLHVAEARAWAGLGVGPGNRPELPVQ